VPELSFFIGKGGVGKTTASAAYAVHNAVRFPSKPVLLLSTDPAHSLSDILQLPLEGKATKIPLGATGRLYAWQVNAGKQFQGFLDEHKQRILEIIDRGSLFSRQDIEPLLDKSLPGMAEISALLALQSALESGKYDRIVVDTAPFGHTLRLFGLPEHFLHFLDFLDLAISRDRVLAQHFGGRTRRGNDEFLSEWRTTVEGLQESIARKARLFLVTTPEKFSLNESLRACATLGTYSPPLKIGAVVLGVSPDTPAAQKKFVDKFDLPFTLVADADKKICNAYGVIQEKNMYGKKVMGVARTTFIIGPDGRIKHIFRKVKPEGHADEVLEYLKGAIKGVA